MRVSAKIAGTGFEPANSWVKATHFYQQKLPRNESDACGIRTQPGQCERLATSPEVERAVQGTMQQPHVPRCEKRKKPGVTATPGSRRNLPKTTEHHRRITRARNWRTDGSASMRCSFCRVLMFDRRVNMVVIFQINQCDSGLRIGRRRRSSNNDAE